MKLSGAAGQIELTMETKDVDKTFRVTQPGWHEGLEGLEVQEIDQTEPPAPFWVKPNLETWEFLAQDLVKDAQDGIVDIVAESCLHGMVIRGWQGEAWGRLHVNLAKAMKEVMALETPPGPSTFTVGDNALLPVSGQQGQPEPETRVASRDAILKALEAPEYRPPRIPEDWEYGLADVVEYASWLSHKIALWQAGDRWDRIRRERIEPKEAKP